MSFLDSRAGCGAAGQHTPLADLASQLQTVLLRIWHWQTAHEQRIRPCEWEMRGFHRKLAVGGNGRRQLRTCCDRPPADHKGLNITRLCFSWPHSKTACGTVETVMDHIIQRYKELRCHHHHHHSHQSCPAGLLGMRETWLMRGR